MKKLPWLQFYTGDWESDAVAGCSLAAQGLWLRMMCIAHKSERYGYLVQNGSSIPPESIARRCGCTLEQYDSLLSELLRAGVPSTSADGTLYSRRMVKDASTRTKTKERVSRFRNASVTPKRSEVRSQKLEEVKRSAPPPKTGAVAFIGLAFEISDLQDTALAEGFPWVDRQAEYRKADSWLLGNPKRRPKRAAAFMHNWFNRIDKPGGNANGNRVEQRQKASATALGRVLGRFEQTPSHAVRTLPDAVD